MAFGVKMVKLSLKSEYEVEELFEKIKDADFGDAGKPECGPTIPNGKVIVIYFPQIDRNNQVWIVRNKKGVFTVQRSTTIVGGVVKNIAKDTILNGLTDGIAGAFSNLGKPEKKCEADVDHIVEVIQGMGL